MQQPVKRTKKQKLLILLPVFLIGIAGLIFAGINLLKTTPDSPPKTETKSALNTHLPSPELPVKQKNKLEIYMEAARDSAKRQAEWEKDPNSKRFYDPAPPEVAKLGEHTHVGHAKARIDPSSSTDNMDPNEKKVNDRLQKLYTALDQSNTTTKQEKIPMVKSVSSLEAVSPTSPETERLEKLLQEARRPDTVSDPNLDRVEKVLDKVLEIQHPERTTAHPETTQSYPSPTVYSVTTNPTDSGAIEIPYNGPDESGPNGFFGLEQEQDTEAAPKTTTIQAVVPDDQVLQSGSTIKLRLMQDIFVGGHRIPANNFIYGTCAVTNQRLQIQLTSVVSNNEIFPIALKVYDLDGMEGIFVPGAVTRDVTKEGFSQGVSGMGLTSFSTSLGAQATAAGIETAKNLISKKVKAVIVTVRAGHRVLLQPASNGH